MRSGGGFAMVAGVILLGGCVEPRATLPDASADVAGIGDGPAGTDADLSSAMDLPGDRAPDISGDVPIIDTGEDRPVAIDLNDVRPDTVDLPEVAMPKDNGASCGSNTECKNGHCVEGVCCDGACGGKCSSCLNANTGKPDGQCAPVRAGTAHGGDCTASDPTSCGHDGKCDGAGACRNFVAGTMCKGESCPARTSNYSPMSTCDGKGTCVPMPKTCGDYKCAADGLRCRTNCGADVDCNAATYCDGTLCRPDLDAKAVCDRSEQCKSNLCSGRCCNPGVPCKCPQPSAMNVVRNAGLDTDLTGWVPNAGRVWDSDDADGCPFSGSLSLGAADGYLFQCVPVSPRTTLNFGAMVKVATDGSLQNCQVRFTSDPFCGGSLLPVYGSFDYNVAAGSWMPISGSVQSPDGTLAAEVACSGFNFKIDRMYLTAVPGHY